MKIASTIFIHSLQCSEKKKNTRLLCSLVIFFDASQIDRE